MLWTNLKRITRAGFVGFWRNSFISFTSILVMMMALFVVASTIFSNYALEDALTTLQSKVDVNVYFTTDASEEEVLSVKSDLESLPEVAQVEYTSREQALAEFRARHEDDALTLQALDELGENPLGAVLSIRAKETSRYEGVEAFLNEKQEAQKLTKPIIRETNFYKNRDAIERLTNIIDENRKNNALKALALIIAAAFVAFVTIHLAIHNSREEIGVMRLVGGGNFFISAPFIVNGIMQGLVAGVLALLLLYPTLMFKESAFYPFPFFDTSASKLLFEYYIGHFGYIFSVVIGSGIAIGAVSSFLAVRRYLKI